MVPTQSVAKDVGCSQSAVSKIWCKYKQHGKVIKGRHQSVRIENLRAVDCKYRELVDEHEFSDFFIFCQ